MTTLLLSPRYTGDSVTLWRSAIQLGWHVERLQGWQPPQRAQDGDVAIYGEPMFAGHVAAALGLALLEPTFDWVAALPGGYTRRQIRFTTLAQARAWPARAFIKPADDKCFPAQVYEQGSAIAGGDALEATAPVLIAEPVEWQVEYRCFVLDRRVLTLSPYWRNGRLAQDQDGSWPIGEQERQQVEQLCAELLADPAVAVPAALVIDVGCIRDRGWAVVEANPCWAAGLYGCDPAAVLEVLRHACRPAQALTPEQRRWVPVRQAPA